MFGRLQLHHLLYRYQPGAGGHWKSTDNQIVERDADGTVVRVRFTPTPAVATPQAMADLVAHYQTAVEEPLADPLVVLPLRCVRRRPGALAPSASPISGRTVPVSAGTRCVTSDHSVVGSGARIDANAGFRSKCHFQIS